MAFDLASVTKGKRLRAPKIVIYGSEKIGKTTFASSAPASIGIITEEGIDAVDCSAFPRCKTFDDVMACITTLFRDPHDFRSVFVDSLDWLEPLIQARVCVDHKVANIEDIPYGKGFGYAEDFWRQFFAGLDALRNERGMIVMCIAHQQITKVRNPTLPDDYDAFTLKLHKKATAIVSEWADIIGFAAHQIHVRSTDAGFNQKETKAVGTGARMLHLNPWPAFVAGNRYGIPDVPLTWPHFAAALEQAMAPPQPKAA